MPLPDEYDRICANCGLTCNFATRRLGGRDEPKASRGGDEGMNDAITQHLTFLLLGIGAGIALRVATQNIRRWRRYDAMTTKVIRDGKVAVAISPGFGAGWTTWHDGISPFEPKVIEMIEAGRQDEITAAWCEAELGIKNVYCGGASDLRIEWVPVGVRFSINEYDGSESLYRSDELEYKA